MCTRLDIEDRGMIGPPFLAKLKFLVIVYILVGVEVKNLKTRADVEKG